MCELALAHVNTNAIEAAYRRTDLFERRRALMEQWAGFLAGPTPKYRGFPDTRRAVRGGDPKRPIVLAGQISLLDEDLQR